MYKLKINTIFCIFRHSYSRGNDECFFLKSLLWGSVGLFLIFVSCKKIVRLGLKNAPAQTVIQGEVTDSAGPYTVTINQSTDFYADNIFPAISGAIVKISDNLGVTDSLTETAPGVYSTHILKGAPGNTYTLSVWINNINYTATSTMPSPVRLDSIDFLQTTMGIGGNKKQLLSAVVNFQDPARINNYYLFDLYDNGVKYAQNIFIFSDRLSDGKYINHTLRTDTTQFIHTGDTVKVNMYSIDKNIYNYFYQLDLSSNPMSAAPANPQSNISNGALGFFSAHTLQTKTTIAPPVD